MDFGAVYFVFIAELRAFDTFQMYFSNVNLMSVFRLDNIIFITSQLYFFMVNSMSISRRSQHVREYCLGSFSPNFHQYFSKLLHQTNFQKKKKQYALKNTHTQKKSRR